MEKLDVPYTIHDKIADQADYIRILEKRIVFLERELRNVYGAAQELSNTVAEVVKALKQ